MANCEWCGDYLGASARKGKKYCGSECRKAAFNDRSHCGEVRTARWLKSGRISLVVWLDKDAGLRPGMKVKIAEDE